MKQIILDYYPWIYGFFLIAVVVILRLMPDTTAYAKEHSIAWFEANDVLRSRRLALVSVLTVFSVVMVFAASLVIRSEGLSSISWVTSLVVLILSCLIMLFGLVFLLTGGTSPGGIPG